MPALIASRCRSAPCIALQTNLDAFLAIEKYLLVKQGIFTNTHVRGPVGFILDDETCHEVDRLFDLVICEVDAAETH